VERSRDWPERASFKSRMAVARGSRNAVWILGVDRIGMSDPSAINKHSLQSVSEARELVETSLVANATLRLTLDDIKRPRGPKAEIPVTKPRR
jgi:hypothetical protein